MAFSAGSVAHHWNLLIIGVTFLVTYYVIMSIHWKMLCQVIDETTNQKQWLAYYASQPYKYLPTSLFTFSFRAKYAKALGMGVRKSSTAQLIENFNLIGGALGLTIIMLAFQHGRLLGMTVVLSSFLVIFALWRRNEVRIRFKKTNVNLYLRKWLPTFILAMIGWLAAGAAFYFISRIFPSPPSILLAIAANSAAFALGILAVFAPGGIGVRELVFAYFSVEGSVIALWRLVTLMLDVMLGAVAILGINRLTKRPK